MRFSHMRRDDAAGGETRSARIAYPKRAQLGSGGAKHSRQCPPHVPDVHSKIRSLARAGAGRAIAALAGGVRPRRLPRPACRRAPERIPRRRVGAAAWLTGFTGSAGAAVILAESAHVFVDGRYTLQVKAQTDPDVFAPKASSRRRRTNGCATISQGHAPRLRSLAAHRRPRRSGCERPREGRRGTRRRSSATRSTPSATICPRRRSTGDDPSERVRRRDGARQDRGDGRTRSPKGCGQCVLTDPASIAWLFNIRGGDVPTRRWRSPSPSSPPRARTSSSSTRASCPMSTEAYLDPAAQPCARPAPIGERLRRSARRARRDRPRSGADRRTAADCFEDAGGDDRVDASRSGSLAARDQERRRDRRAHAPRTGATAPRWSTFLAWLDSTEPGSLDEIAVADSSKSCRRRPARNRRCRCRTSPSTRFPAPARTAPSSTTVSPTRPTGQLGRGELYLVDSGAQYEDGTTDITRTVAIGTPTEEMRGALHARAQGHDRDLACALSRRARAASTSTCSPAIRAVERRPRLRPWHRPRRRLLSRVHEGPQRIAKRASQKLLPGMIVSNEPGYYKTGALRHPHRKPDRRDQAKAIENGDMPCSASKR